jgi:hypothetical protein
MRLPWPLLGDFSAREVFKKMDLVLIINFMRSSFLLMLCNKQQKKASLNGSAVFLSTYSIVSGKV